MRSRRDPQSKEAATVRPSFAEALRKPRLVTEGGGGGGEAKVGGAVGFEVNHTRSNRSTWRVSLTREVKNLRV